MKRVIALLMMALLSIVPALGQVNLEPVPGTSRVGFSLRHFTGRADGEFASYQGRLDFDSEAPQNSKVSFQVDVASIDTKNRKRDDHLRSEDYFDVARHPKMTFTSDNFRRTGENRYMVTGDLTIKGHSKKVTLPVTLERAETLWATGEASRHFESTFTLDRTEFGVGEESSILGSEVRVELKLEVRDPF